MARSQGRVKSFNAGKGFGFIDIGSGTDVFLHIKDCTDGKQPLTGDILSFILEPSASKPGQMVAKSVEGGTGAKEMFPGPQEPALEVPGNGTHVGKVRTWNDTKGYGFIDLPGQPNVWLHVKECVNTQPQTGDWVRFDIIPSDTKPGQMVAKNVTGGSQPLGTRGGYGPQRDGAAMAYGGPYGVQQPGTYVVQQSVPMQQAMPGQQTMGVQQSYPGMQTQYVQQQVQPQYVQQQPGMQQYGVQQPMQQYAVQQPGMQDQAGMQQYGVQQPMQQYGMQDQTGMQQYGVQQPMQQYAVQQPGMQVGMQPGMQQVAMQQPGMQFQQAMPQQASMQSMQSMQPMQQQAFMQTMPQQQMQPMMQPGMDASSMGASVDPAQMSMSGVAPASLAPMPSMPLEVQASPEAQGMPLQAQGVPDLGAAPPPEGTQAAPAPAVQAAPPPEAAGEAAEAPAMAAATPQ